MRWWYECGTEIVICRQATFCLAEVWKSVPVLDAVLSERGQQPVE